MTLEIGGRADKTGNQYENHFLTKLLLRVCEEKLTSIEVEPLDPENNDIEYIATQTNGTKLYYQCKASNGAHKYWSVADLERLKILSNAKKHVLASSENEYHFISPLPYSGIEDLCDRARTNHSAEDFLNYQLTNQQLRKCFEDCEKYFGLKREIPHELEQIVYILSHCYFELVPFTYEAQTDLESSISRYFVGKSSTAKNILASCVNENKWYGILITAPQIISYMEDNGFPPRMLGLDERIFPRIQTLNTVHWDTYNPINEQLFHRSATKEVLNHIHHEHSVILHGGAGVGKSGCVEEISAFLQSENIPFLRIKLDKYIPQTSADEYGKSLGLPESPIHCLQRLSGGKHCVLILDQLDNLRWSSHHSATALEVCKEMIRQATAINQSHDCNISIVFITRTFDYKHDNGIKSLFLTDSPYSTVWKEVHIDILSETELKDIIGSEYHRLSSRLKTLLRTPSSLFVWTKLSENSRRSNITSTNQLIMTWWSQILEECEKKNISRREANDFISDFATKLNNTSLFSLHRRIFAANWKIIDALTSCGILTENNEKISFSHQSFFDYFLATDNIQSILSGEKIISIIGRKDEQTPNRRYRLLSLLQGLSEQDSSFYLNTCCK